MSEPATTTGRLKANALGLGDALILGLASSGPAQSVAVSLAAIVATVGYAGVLPIVISFLPMIGIGIGYYRLNLWDANCGATYAWVGRALNPYLGFLAGWMMLLYYTLGTASLTAPLGTYTLSLLGLGGLAGSSTWVALTGSLWALLVMSVAVVGIKLSARLQWALALFEYAVLAVFAVLALVYVAGGHPGTTAPSAQWFSLDAAGGFKGLGAGILIAVFLYSGWDTSVYVNEETGGSRRNPGLAALMGIVILLLIYSLSVFSYQGVVPASDLQAHAGNALAYIGTKLAGGFGGLLMSLVVLTGTAASLQAAVVSASRIGFSMGSDRVLPGILARVHQRYGTPVAATLIFGVLNVAFVWAFLSVGSISAAFANIVSALGILAGLFYSLTAITAIWHYRRTLTRSTGDLLLGGLLPALGAAFLLGVIAYSVISGSTTSTVLFWGLGSAALGIPLAFLAARMGRSPYFSRRHEAP